MLVVITTLGGIMVVSGMMLPFLIDGLKAFMRAKNTGEKIEAVSQVTAWAGTTILLNVVLYLLVKVIYMVITNFSGVI